MSVLPSPTDKADGGLTQSSGSPLPKAPGDSTQKPVVSSTEGKSARIPLPTSVDKKRVQWNYVLPIALIHLAALLVFVPWLFSWAGLAAYFVGIVAFGQLGIPIGYHRLLTHRSFRAPKWLERTFVFFALCSAQGTPARWVAWHRMHHQHSDEQDDPHSPLVAFFWAHFGWLMWENRATTNFSFYQTYARDILEDPFYMRLEKQRWLLGAIYFLHAVLYFAVCLGICIAIYGMTLPALQLTLSLFVWGVVARTVHVWHITWAVNSLAHIWGYRNYNTPDASRNNWFVALITAGEGWHNNHHHDQAACTVQHRWWELDPNYYIIKLLETVGLAWQVVPRRHVRKAKRASA